MGIPLYPTDVIIYLHFCIFSDNFGFGGDTFISNRCYNLFVFSYFSDNFGSVGIPLYPTDVIIYLHFCIFSDNFGFGGDTFISNRCYNLFVFLYFFRQFWFSGDTFISNRCYNLFVFLYFSHSFGSVGIPLYPTDVIIYLYFCIFQTVFVRWGYLYIQQML